MTEKVTVPLSNDSLLPDFSFNNKTPQPMYQPQAQKYAILSAFGNICYLHCLQIFLILKMYVTSHINPFFVIAPEYIIKPYLSRKKILHEPVFLFILQTCFLLPNILHIHNL